jgi:hypothetical protein
MFDITRPRSSISIKSARVVERDSTTSLALEDSIAFLRRFTATVDFYPTGWLSRGPGNRSPVSERSRPTTVGSGSHERDRGRRRYERGMRGENTSTRTTTRMLWAFGDEDEDYAGSWRWWMLGTDIRSTTWSVNLKTRFALPMTSCVKEPSLASPPWQSHILIQYHLHLTVAVYIHTFVGLVLRKVVLSTTSHFWFSFWHVHICNLTPLFWSPPACQVHTCSTVLISQLFCKWRSILVGNASTVPYVE